MISKSTLDMMYPYEWTTFTAKISALGQPSSENCNAQNLKLLLIFTGFICMYYCPGSWPDRKSVYMDGLPPEDLIVWS
jgi:hypothetical protein